MCGVAGLITWNQTYTSFSPQRVCSAMTNALAHRGNDGEHFFTSPSERCFFGHRRLSIIDTTSAGQQPMQSNNGRFTLVYNGEIYNFKELKGQLQKEGACFTSESDTEVLLHGYILWGTAIFKKLRGMFAGGIWDEQKQSLIIFRDHIGIKPLYWWHDQHHAAFASELTALRKHPLIPSTINQKAVAEYFSFGSIHAPRTIFNDIYALEPGHFLQISEQNIKQTNYWNLSNIQSEADHTENISTTILNLLHDTVAHHMISDIPVGAFLSGGLDSSCIVALMKEQTTKPINTFSIGFDYAGRDIDESTYATNIAEYLGTKHQNIICTSKTFIDNFDHFIAHLDQPSTDGFNSFLVSQVTAQKVHVALSGLGGDELFLGYRYHQEIMRMMPLADSSFYPALSHLSALANKSSIIKKILYHSYFRGFERLHQNQTLDGYLAARTIANPLFRPNEHTKEYQADAHAQLHAMFDQEKDLLNAYSKAELAFYTPGTLLRDADVTGMAFTLEVRFPFLDIPLIEYMLKLPSSYKISTNKLYPKPLLRSVLSTLMPLDLLVPAKRGFEMPLGSWILEHASLLEPIKNNNFIHQELLKKEITLLKKKPTEYLPIWQSILFTHWLAHHHLSYA